MKCESIKQFIFEDDRPFLSCHASTLVVLPNGEVLAAWFGGTAEKNSDVAIWYARRSAAGQWGAPERIADEEGIAHWNPVLFQGQNGTLHLYYKVGHEITQWYTMVINSKDQGHTWSSPIPLVEGDIGGRGPVRNKPITLSNGAILAPASIEAESDWNGFRELWDACTDISYDGGRTWTKSDVPLDHASLKHDKPLKANGVIQPTLWESDNGNVHMLLRSSGGHIYRSDSADLGKTWSPAYPTELPNNNSGIDLVKMENGVLALVYNPVSSTWGLRTPLVVRFSSDNGLSWEHEFVLENEPGEYSYPAIVSKGNELFLTYTWKRERIAFWKLSI